MAGRPNLLITEKQKGILTFYAAGLSLKQIGHEIGMSRQGMDCHIADIKRKTGLITMSQLVRYSVSVGLIPNFIKTKLAPQSIGL